MPVMLSIPVSLQPTHAVRWNSQRRCQFLLRYRLSSAEGFTRGLRIRPSRSVSFRAAFFPCVCPRASHALFSPTASRTPPPLDFAKEPFALKLLLQDSQGLFDIVVTNEAFRAVSLVRDLSSSTSASMSSLNAKQVSGLPPLCPLLPSPRRSLRKCDVCVAQPHARARAPTADLPLDFLI